MRIVRVVLVLMVGVLVASLSQRTSVAESKQASAASAVSIDTPRGASLAAAHHAPTAANGTAVVLAPGQGYHKELPLLPAAANALREAGFHAVRYDWAYFTEKGKPSSDGTAEREDLEAVIAWTRALPGVERVIVCGKSLGSLVALERATEKSDDLAGLVLLTFPIHNPGASDKPFLDLEDFDKVGCPRLVITGDADPLCELKALYGVLAKSAAPPPVVVVPGEHSLRDPNDKKNQPRTNEHIATAVNALVLWCRRFAE